VEGERPYTGDIIRDNSLGEAGAGAAPRKIEDKSKSNFLEIRKRFGHPKVQSRVKVCANRTLHIL
jgi:hypothetical protein